MEHMDAWVGSISLCYQFLHLMQKLLKLFSFLLRHFQFMWVICQSSLSIYSDLPQILLNLFSCSSFCVTSLLTCCSHLDRDHPLGPFSIYFYIQNLLWDSLLIHSFILKTCPYHLPVICQFAIQDIYPYQSLTPSHIIGGGQHSNTEKLV